MHDTHLHADIDELIRVTDDAKDRAMILIMQRILLRVEQALDDEVALQDKVLNGLVPFHKMDHELIMKLRDLDVVGAVIWVNEFKSSDPETVCAYSRAKMQNECDAKKVLQHKLTETMFEVGKTAVMLILGATIFAFAQGYPFLQKIFG